jgi:hypothetical protein
MNTGNGPARLLIRIDDICQTSNWRVLRQLESIMVEEGVRPIVAIVPKNMDDNLVIEPPNPTYWEDLSRWQTLGYSMALHGYHHTFAQSGGGIMGISSDSEFTGLPESTQVDMLHYGIEELESHGIHPTVWVADRSCTVESGYSLHQRRVLPCSPEWTMRFVVDTSTGLEGRPSLLWCGDRMPACESMGGI